LLGTGIVPCGLIPDTRFSNIHKIAIYATMGWDGTLSEPPPYFPEAPLRRVSGAPVDHDPSQETPARATEAFAFEALTLRAILLQARNASS
jgi:hypothetical protein